MNSDNIEKIIGILERAKVHVTDDSDTMWTCYENGQEFREDIDSWIERLKSGDETVWNTIECAFAPAFSFQDHSLQNGWAEEFLDLAAQMDQCLLKPKKSLCKIFWEFFGWSKKSS